MVGGAITVDDHRRRHVDRRGCCVQIDDGHHAHEQERRQC